MTRRRPHAAPPSAPAVPWSRAATCVLVAAALLLQILLPAGASPRPRDVWWSADGVAVILCIGRPDLPAADRSLPGPSDLPVDGRTGAGHSCCVLCTTPGVATVAVPLVGPAPAWHRIAPAPPRRLAVTLVPERSPIRPRAPPAA